MDNRALSKGEIIFSLELCKVAAAVSRAAAIPAVKSALPIEGQQIEHYLGLIADWAKQNNFRVDVKLREPTSEEVVAYAAGGAIVGGIAGAVLAGPLGAVGGVVLGAAAGVAVAHFELSITMLGDGRMELGLTTVQ